MTSFSNDTDILRYEPILFGQLHLQGQVLLSGENCILNGTSAFAEGADFISADIEPGCVIYLRSGDGGLDGAYEIVSVDSAENLTVSVVRSQSSDPAIAPPDGSGIFFRVTTYRPQIAEVGLQLTEYFGIRPGVPGSEIGVEDILDTGVLRTASTFAVISSVYAMLGSNSNKKNFWNKSLHYKKLFEKARERCRLSIDLGNDGVVDITQSGASVRLLRD
jgi:hypothetical protein